MNDVYEYIRFSTANFASIYKLLQLQQFLKQATYVDLFIINNVLTCVLVLLCKLVLWLILYGDTYD